MRGENHQRRERERAKTPIREREVTTELKTAAMQTGMEEEKAAIQDSH